MAAARMKTLERNFMGLKIFSEFSEFEDFDLLIKSGPIPISFKHQLIHLIGEVLGRNERPVLSQPTLPRERERGKLVRLKTRCLSSPGPG